MKSPQIGQWQIASRDVETWTKELKPLLDIMEK